MGVLQPQLLRVQGSQATALTATLFAAQTRVMSKALSLVIIAIMAIQIIKPLGLPGLRQRRDFWKLALLALGAIGLTILLSHAT